MAIRTYGLSGSGIDVDQMVKDLMKARRAQYDNLYQKKTLAEWKKTDYSSIYSQLKDFRNNTLFNYKLQSTSTPKKVSGTNDSAVTATANADALNMTHQIKVDQVASGVQKTSTAGISVGTDKTSIRSQFGLGTGATPFLITINDGTKSKDVLVDPDQSIYDLVSNINKLGLHVQANYDATLDRFFIGNTTKGANTALDFTSSGIEVGGNYAEGISFLQNSLKLDIGTASRSSSASIGSADSLTKSMSDLFGLTSDTSFTMSYIDGSGTTVSKTINVSSTETLQDFINNINSEFGANVASFDPNYGRFTLAAPAGGKDLSFDQSSPGIDFLKDKLKLNTQQYAENGKDALFNLDGVYLSQGKNDFTISGVNYSIKSTTSSAASVTVSADIDKTIENVKSFITAYNSLISKITSELNEDRYSDFTPLTDAQKAEMKESEILAWEAKAKSGLLRRDSILSDIQRSLRSDFTSAISGLTGDYKTASSIGLKLGSYIDDDGKIVTDKAAREQITLTQAGELKLREALEKDPNIVYKIFGTNGDTSSEDGLMTRMYDTLDTMLKRIETQAGTSAVEDQSSLGKEITDYSERMYNLNLKLQDEENMYYNRFNAMETALQKLSNQSSWLMQQFSS